MAVGDGDEVVVAAGHNFEVDVFAAGALGDAAGAADGGDVPGEVCGVVAVGDDFCVCDLGSFEDAKAGDDGVDLAGPEILDA